MTGRLKDHVGDPDAAMSDSTTPTDDGYEDSTYCNCMAGIGTSSNSNCSDSVGQGQALDIILVQQQHGELETTNNSATLHISVACNDFNVSFPGRCGIVRVYLNENYVDGLDMKSSKGECRFMYGHTKKPNAQGLQQLLQLFLSNRNLNSTHPSQPQCHCPVSFHLTNATTGVVLGIAQATLFLWQSTDRIIACDIDGTITKSNVRGVWDTIVTERYDHVHPGVAGFLQQLEQHVSAGRPSSSSSLVEKQEHQQPHYQQQQFRIVYLTSRPMSLVATTRKFLQTFTQNDCSKTMTTTTSRLPIGPVFCNLSDLTSVLLSELVWKNIYCYKRDVLTSQVLVPFSMVRHAPLPMPSSRAASKQPQQQTLVIGIGNTVFDTMAYEMAGIPLDCIFQINDKGKILCFDKSETHGEALGRDPKHYASLQGTIFQGYTDPKLLQEVQRKLNQSCY